MTPSDLYELSQRAAVARELGDGALAHECWARIVEAVEEQAAHTWRAPGFEPRGAHTRASGEAPGPKGLARTQSNRPGDGCDVPGPDHGRNPQ